MLRLWRDIHGSLMPLAAIAILLLFVGIFALTIDTGISYKDQSNLEAKLANCANYAAAEYTYFRIRKAARASIRPDKDELLLPDPHLKPEDALERLRLYVQDCVRGGELGELRNSLVTRAAIEHNSEGREILVFDASTPQSRTFSAQKGDALIISQSGKLLPFFTRDVSPPSLPVDQNVGISLVLDCRSEHKPGPSMRALAVAMRNTLLSLNMVRPDLMFYGFDTRIRGASETTRGAAFSSNMPTGHFVVITDTSCSNNESAKEAVKAGGSGDTLSIPFCAIGMRPEGWQMNITTADCAAEALWVLSGDRPEVRKTGTIQ